MSYFLQKTLPILIGFFHGNIFNAFIYSIPDGGQFEK
jgi:hypothetical protein